MKLTDYLFSFCDPPVIIFQEELFPFRTVLWGGFSHFHNRKDSIEQLTTADPQ